jgi:hypothetical protein
MTTGSSRLESALGVVVAVAIVFRSRWAVAVYAVALVAGLIFMEWAVRESEHSDGKLVLLGTGVQLTGLAAVALSREDSLGGDYPTRSGSIEAMWADTSPRGGRFSR